MLKGTAFEPGPFGNINPAQAPDYRRKTDEQGSFSFESKPGAHTVVAVGSAGLGQARCFDFSKPLEIRLQPWGRIEGSVRTRDGQWGDRKLKWQRDRKPDLLDDAVLRRGRIFHPFRPNREIHAGACSAGGWPRRD